MQDRDNGQLLGKSKSTSAIDIKSFVLCLIIGWSVENKDNIPNVVRVLLQELKTDIVELRTAL